MGKTQNLRKSKRKRSKKTHKGKQKTDLPRSLKKGENNTQIGNAKEAQNKREIDPNFGLKRKNFEESLDQSGGKA